MQNFLCFLWPVSETMCFSMSSGRQKISMCVPKLHSSLHFPAVVFFVTGLAAGGDHGDTLGMWAEALAFKW